MERSRIALALVLMLFLTACGNNDDGDVSRKAKQNPADRAAALDKGPRASQSGKLNEDLAIRGESLFEDRLCSDCHNLGEADIAPDLLGVLDRRTYQWLKMQITEPEWMNQHDPITKSLIEEFGLEMIETGVSEADAEAILHFLWRESAKTAR